MAELWLEGGGSASASPGERLRARLGEDRILRVPGAHHALAGLLARRAGFEALYVSGAAASAAMGLPDLGIMTIDEIAFLTRTIHRATGLPLIVDADTGYGEALNVMRTVRELEAAGAAAIQLEDQELPKKCGHLSDKRLVSAEAMALKLQAASRARRHALIVARTDAAGESLDDAIARARLYVEAGADVIFGEALTTEDAFRRFTREVPAPVLANMTEFGRTPSFTAEQFEALGCRVVIWPVSSLRVAARAIEDLYGALAKDGTTESMKPRMQTRKELYETIRYHAYEELDGSIVKSVLPEGADD